MDFVKSLYLMIVNDTVHKTFSVQIKRYKASQDRRVSNDQTHHFPDAEWMRYLFCHGKACVKTLYKSTKENSEYTG